MRAETVSDRAVPVPTRPGPRRPVPRLAAAPASPQPSVAPAVPVLEPVPVPRVRSVLDRVAAAVLLVLAAPLLLVLALLVLADSRGPVIFRQRRCGLGGEEFVMLKLRTMVPDAERLLPALRACNEATGPLFKLRRDPRVTRVGRVLRRTSLDELPQLVNVLRGEMSLVGPRPALPHEVAAYDHRARGRLRVKPGITGLWQVSGRSHLSWEDSLRLDLQYVDECTLLLDVRIMARTLAAVVRRDGAY